ncbi:MAG: RHS repeat-associated core domain-containing protein [Phycisphaerales bacterium]|nr:RHS repeat-associated core domain-containing protein [Phycisphaerales bacterium]
MLGVGGPNSNLAPIMLSHIGARWYQPDVGRFVQRDPIGLEGGLNVYAYVENEPLHSVDPLGLRTWAEWFLDWTGGRRNTRLDRVGTKIGQRTLTGSAITPAFAAGSYRVRKKMPLPGYPKTTSVLTKIPGVGLKNGMIAGRYSLYGFIASGLYDSCVIVYTIGEEFWEPAP